MIIPSTPPNCALIIRLGIYNSALTNKGKYHSFTHNASLIQVGPICLGTYKYINKTHFSICISNMANLCSEVGILVKWSEMVTETSKEGSSHLTKQGRQQVILYQVEVLSKNSYCGSSCVNQSCTLYCLVFAAFQNDFQNCFFHSGSSFYSPKWLPKLF